MLSRRTFVVGSGAMAISPRARRRSADAASEPLPAGYSITRFEPPNGGPIDSMAINDNGLVVGSVVGSPGLVPRAFAWSRRMPFTWLAAEEVASAALAVDGYPNAVGWIGQDQGSPRPVMWRNLVAGGPAVELAPDDPRPGAATAIVAYGPTYGYLIEPGSYVSTPMHFSEFGPLPIEALPGGASPLAINGTWVRVGSARRDATEGSPEVAVRWGTSELEELPTPDGANSVARAVNDEGLVAGEVVERGSGGYLPRATIWRDRKAVGLPMPEGFDASWARGIDASGAVVGTVSRGEGRDSLAVIWRGGDAVDLNTRVTPDAGVTLREAIAVNRHGEIVCIGWQGEDRRTVGFLLTPEKA